METDIPPVKSRIDLVIVDFDCIFWDVRQAIRQLLWRRKKEPRSRSNGGRGSCTA